MKDTKKMVQLAVLVAIIAIMAFTPLGFLRVGIIEITFMMIPVAVAAIAVGPAGGAIAGGAFGLTSFLQGFGGSASGVMLMDINPIFFFILTMVPRILAGWLPGLIYVAVNKRANKTVAAMAASISAPLFNSILFIGTLLLLFNETALAIITWMLLVNVLVEAVVGLITGTAVSRSLVHFFPDRKSVIEKG